MTVILLPTPKITPISLVYNSVSCVPRQTTMQYFLDEETLEGLTVWLGTNKNSNAEEISKWIGENQSLLSNAFGHVRILNYPSGARVKEWGRNGFAHNVGAPSSVVESADGYDEDWRVDGKHKRENGPVHISDSRDHRYVETWLNATGDEIYLSPPVSDRFPRYAAKGSPTPETKTNSVLNSIPGVTF